MPTKRKATAKRGPKPQRLKIDDTFEGATRKFLAAKRPAGGWPPMPPVYAPRAKNSEEE